MIRKTMVTVFGVLALLTQENSNYIRTGVFKDYDLKQYMFTEVGKSIELSKGITINGYYGMKNYYGTEKVIDFSQSFRNYWGINTEFRF